MITQSWLQKTGEKIDEELISPIEYGTCYETEDQYIIYPFLPINVESPLHENTDLNGMTLIDQDTFKYNTKYLEPLDKKQIAEILDKYNLI